MTTSRRKSERSTGRKLRSPGRPGVAQRFERQRFWVLIALGLPSEEAAVRAGVSQPVGTRWFREAGGMPPSHLAPSAPPPSRRYLCLEEREEIALLLARGVGLREIARRLRRAASTISREVRCNAATRSGGFD
ncbi:helix-turn-helix domain-containing protein, partial [Wenxinia marina]|uniref:helix-turn-helix domain-containing protein n=1 Tax=Wenxinia marina TaxID=390641 RepID=UPI0020C7C23E